LRLLLDEMYSQAIAVQLRRKGHDVIAVLDRPDLSGEPDETVFAAATLEGRAIVTNDGEDHVALFAAALADRRDHPGLLLTSDRSLTRREQGFGALVRALDRALRDHPAEDALENQLRWLP
jgi:predicted nuclease of predicted toxin-antitoxin system